MASYPHLIDVGIMGHCIHGRSGLCTKAGIDCYQSGQIIAEPNMSVADFRWIAEQSKGWCSQFALGGRGDPDQHENFEEILKICRENNLVPNFTTSGYGMTPEIAKLCSLTFISRAQTATVKYSVTDMMTSAIHGMGMKRRF